MDGHRAPCDLLPRGMDRLRHSCHGYTHRPAHRPVHNRLLRRKRAAGAEAMDNFNDRFVHVAAVRTRSTPGHLDGLPDTPPQLLTVMDLAARMS
jgi:hypothetical protein